MRNMAPTREQIYEWLEEVKDPEIPVLSLVDMGIIRQVTADAEKVFITITPTFVGCPALDHMKSEIRQCLEKRGFQSIHIDVSYQEPWSSDDITEKGRIALRNFGLAPPPSAKLFTDLDILEHAVCPRCGGTNTEMKTPFGPTLCRSIHYCYHCRESFEQFKPI
jgi:ring-1,2-phenylacetyl-CoA epoxidase subunit PaaD